VKIKYSNPKRHILGAKHVYQAQNGDDSFAGATFRRAEENKKEREEGRKERRKTPNSDKLAIRPDHPRRQIKIKLCVVGGLRCVVILVKCDPNRSRGYGAVGGRKWPFRYFGQWLTQQLVLPYKS